MIFGEHLRSDVQKKLGIISALDVWKFKKYRTSKNVAHQEYEFIF